MATLDRICRHPVKSLGEETIDRVTLEAGRHMPWDRVWAIAHGRSEFDHDNPAYVRSRNFVIQSTNPALAQIACAFDEAAEALTLAHPALGEITVRPGGGGDLLTDWIAPIAGASGPPPYRLAARPGAGMTDFPETHISIGSLASLRALEQMAGASLAHIRFRMNLWVEGLAPWEEFDWLDREIAVGPARLKVIDRVTRCNATNASPETGRRDTDIPRLLHGRFGHMDFGVYAQVTQGGEIRAGDEVRA